MPESTGDVQIKGIIAWPKTAVGYSANASCPYAYQNTTASLATRACEDFGFTQAPKWKEPDSTSCAYKTKTTRQLSDLAQV